MLKKFSNLTQIPNVLIEGKQVGYYPNPIKITYLCIKATISGYKTGDNFGRTIFRVLLNQMPSDVTLSLYRLKTSNIQDITYSDVITQLFPLTSKIDVIKQDGVIVKDIDIIEFMPHAETGASFDICFAIKCECLGTVLFGIPDISINEVLVGEMYNYIGQSYIHEKIEQDIGFVGKGSVNLFNEQLTFNMLNLVTSGKYPVSIHATYNENKNGIFGEHVTNNYEYQAIRKNKWLLIIDSTGNEYYYEAINRVDAKERYGIEPYTIWGDLYINLTDFTYALSASQEVHIINKDKSIMKFYIPSGELVSLRIKEIVTNKCTITFKDSYINGAFKISNIKSSSNDEIKLTYNSFGNVDRIDYDKMRYVWLKYDTISGKQLLTSIEYCDNNNAIESEVIQEESIYEYSTVLPNKLTLAYDNRTKQGYKYDYTSGKVSKVSAILKGSTDITGYINITKSLGKTITINHLDEEAHYFFDEYGKCYLISDKYGNVNTVNYEQANIGVIPFNNGRSYPINNAGNLLFNPFFEGTIFDSTFKWVKNSSSIGNASSALGYNGKQSLRIYNIESNEYIINQSIPYYMDTNEKISFRGFVRGSGKVFISVEVFNVTYEKEILLKNTWEEVTIENMDVLILSQHSIDVKIRIIKGTDVRLSNFTLCYGEKPTSQNFLVNSNFYHSKVGWNIKGNYLIYDPLPNNYPLNNVFTKAISLMENFGDTHEIKQIVNLSGSAGEELLFSLFGDPYLNMNDICEPFIEVDYHVLGTKTYTFKFKPYINGYQFFSNSIITESAYSKVTVGLKYRSVKLAFFSGFGLYKAKYGTYYNFNEKKSLTEIAQGDNAINIDFKEDNNAERIIDATGEMYTYTYNNKRNLTNISDSSGNKFEFEYDDNDYLSKSKIISRNNKLMISDQTFDDNGNLLTSKDYKGNISSFEYDEKERLVTENSPIGLVKHFEYDLNDNLVKVDIDLEDSYVTHNYTYNTDKNYKTINVHNGSLYEFNRYDAWGNLEQVNLDNKKVNENLYYKINNINTGLLSSKIYPNDSYTFTYDTLNRLTDVKYNDIIKSKLKYDIDGNLIQKEDLDDSSKVIYKYDTSGNLIKTTNTKENNVNTFSYDYDNLGGIQQKSIELTENNSSLHLNYNYVYDYEYNGYTIGGYFSRLDVNFQEDVIFEKPEGIYGATPVLNTVLVENNFESGRKVLRFSKNTSSLAYETSSINKDRTDKNYGSKLFNKEGWNNTFKTFKEVFLWVKFDCLTTSDVSTKLISMGSDSEEIASVTVNRLGIPSFTYNGTSIGNVSIKPGEWTLIGIGLEQMDYDTKIYTSVNGSYVTLSLSGKNVTDITRILIGEYRDSNVTNDHLSGGSLLEMPFDILYAAIGAHKHDRVSYKGIYEEGYKYIFRDVVNPASGVIYYNPEVYKDMDVIPLNGSLTSTKGLKPLEYTYSDPSFKINKAKIFELDRKRSEGDKSYTNRHIYGSYGENVGLDVKSKSLLTYDFGLQNEGTISLRFKCKYVQDWRDYPLRTILCCPSPTSGSHKLVIWIDNKSQTLVVVIDGTVKYTSLSVQPEKWHLLTLTWDNIDGLIELDDVTYLLEQDTKIDLTGCKTYIGSNVQNGIPVNHLVGNIEMLSYSELTLDIHSDIKTNGNLISVLTEYDEAQRPFKKEINTGIKKLNHHYKYHDEDQEVKQVPDMEILPDGTNIIYSYDRAGNIVHQIKTKNNKVIESIHYKYDVSGRLLSEKCYNDTIFGYCFEYVYDNDGNITLKNEYNSDGTIKFKYKYIYSPTIKDQLIRIDSFEDEGDFLMSQFIEYNTNDAFRPSRYKGNALTWEGRRLTAYGNISYKYNNEGIRISKNVNNQITSYVLEGNKIVKEIKPGHTVFYHYDQEGMLTGFNYNGNEYFYIRSLTGNIEKIIDNEGIIKVEYKYDAWGNVEIISDSIIRDINSFLYKGYYYDFETKLYYCNSRYYDPLVGRWISADDMSFLDTESLNGLNLFAYCNNNPVMMSDPDGCLPKWARWVIGGTLIVGAIALTALTGGAAAVAVASVIGLKGTLAGAIIGGAVAGAALGAASGAMISVGTQVISTGKVDMNKVGKDAFTGAISGAIAGGIFGGIKYAKDASNVASKISGLSSAQSKLDNAFRPLKSIKNLSGMPHSGSNIASTVGQSAANYNSAYINLFNTQVSNYFIKLTVNGVYAGAQLGVKKLVEYGIDQIW